MPTQSNCLQLSIFALAIFCLAADNQEGLKVGRQSDGSGWFPPTNFLLLPGFKLSSPVGLSTCFWLILVKLSSSKTCVISPLSTSTPAKYDKFCHLEVWENNLVD